MIRLRRPARPVSDLGPNPATWHFRIIPPGSVTASVDAKKPTP